MKKIITVVLLGLSTFSVLADSKIEDLNKKVQKVEMQLNEKGLFLTNQELEQQKINIVIQELQADEVTIDEVKEEYKLDAQEMRQVEMFFCCGSEGEEPKIERL